jgi:enamine deaminase RidA (YjgF/YER057c/UK114 family)
MNATPQRAEVRVSGKIPSCETAVEWLKPAAVNGLASCCTSRFTGASGVTEWHVALVVSAAAPNPFQALETTWLAALSATGIDPASTLMRRVFCSDVLNQHPQLTNFSRRFPGAFSALGQTPLSGGKLAIWSQHLYDPHGNLETEGGGSHYALTRGPLHHHWISGLNDPSGNPAALQTMGVLHQHEQWLAHHQMSLAENVVRTWWYVRNIDANYPGLVQARRSHFSHHGLTEKTHYIASTGIEGAHSDPKADICLDSYAISGLSSTQVEYLSAPLHLGPTYKYGVTFERATAIAYSDRRHILISGTASIDAAGNIVHPGDVVQQLDRALENISALLATARASLEDLSVILVYLRDPADHQLIGKILNQRFTHLPTLILHAPVCRPGWLVEIEGIAMVATHQPDLPDF